MTNVYTRSEVARHNNEKDLWIVMHGSVYDLTDFLTKHPGGEEVLLNLAGRDGTVCFDEIGHTMEAILLRETFKIGEILADDNAIASSPAESQDKEEPVNWEYKEIKQEETGALPVIIAAGVIIYAIVFYFFWF